MAREGALDIHPGTVDSDIVCKRAGGKLTSKHGCVHRWTFLKCRANWSRWFERREVRKLGGRNQWNRVLNTSDGKCSIDRIAQFPSSVYCAFYSDGNHIPINNYPQQSELNGWNGPRLTIEIGTSSTSILKWGFHHFDESIVQRKSHCAQLFYIRSTLVLTNETSSHRGSYA